MKNRKEWNKKNAKHKHKEEETQNKNRKKKNIVFEVENCFTTIKSIFIHPWHVLEQQQHEKKKKIKKKPRNEQDK